MLNMTDHFALHPAGTKNYVKFRKGAVKETMDKSAIRLGTPVFKKPMRSGGGTNPFANKPN